MKERKSFFSKDSIINIIEETLAYISKTNKDCVIPDKKTVGKYLLDKHKINDAIYELLINVEKTEECYAMVKKGRCNNPITKNHNKFCALHLNNEPAMTWDKYEIFLAQAKFLKA